MQENVIKYDHDSQRKFSHFYVTQNIQEGRRMDFKAEAGPENVVTIKVVGVGGAGNNVVNRMVKAGTQGV